MLKMTMVALRVSLVTLLLTGVAYPLAVTGVAQLVFPARANGSLTTDGRGRVVGSELIGQRFAAPGYFWPRPSATGDQPYDAANSAGANLGPTAAKLRTRVASDAAKLRAAHGAAAGELPDDLVTTSASGLDPHVSPAAARWQAARVATARGVSVARVQQLVDAAVEGRELGFLGEPRVNVLLLNLALDRTLGSPPASGPTATG